MDWKSNHLLLAEKIVELIIKSPEGLSLDVIDARAQKHGIDMRTLDAALERIHKLRSIERSTVKGTIRYRVKQKVEPKGPASHVSWLRLNYPWPKDFVMPFPEIDMSYLFLKPAQLKEYKAMAKGIPIHMMRDYGRRS